MKKQISIATLCFMAMLTLLPSSAFGHVHVEPSESPKGGYGTFTVRVPNEDDIQSTNKVEIDIPQDEIISFVTVMPTPGWSYELQKVASDKKVEGKAVGEVVNKIVFKDGNIKPGEFQEFKITLGPLPEKANSLTLKTIQTYTDGRESKWIEEQVGDKEPESPAPVIKLRQGGDDDHADSASKATEGSKAEKDDDSSDVLLYAALGISIAALALGGVALAKKK